MWHRSAWYGLWWLPGVMNERVMGIEPALAAFGASAGEQAFSLEERDDLVHAFAGFQIAHQEGLA